MATSPGAERDNPWAQRRVLAYAHQGGAWEAPSSTRFAIGRALEAGATGIELDVHATADRHLVVCHDETVDRTTDGSGTIASLTLAELTDLDNAYRFAPGADVTDEEPEGGYPYRGRAPRDRRFGIATLEEVLEEFPGVVLNLDIKRTAPEVEPYEELLARVLADHGRTDDVIVASFHDAATEAFSAAAPHVAVSAGTGAVAGFVQSLRAGAAADVRRYAALQVPHRFGETTVVDAAFVDAAHAQGVAVHVWTINDRAEMEEVLDLGVDGVITDRPSVLCELLEERGGAWSPA